MWASVAVAVRRDAWRMAGDGPCAVLRRDRGMGRQVTILHRLRDRDPADDGVCPIGGARDRSMRTLTRWVAVLALCPGCHLDASASIPVACEHCTTSHLCTTHLSGVTPRNDKHWCRRAAFARRARGRCCASLGDNVPLSTALPLINKQLWGHMPQIGVRT